MDSPQEQFWFQLSLSLGCTVAELKKKMSYKEFLYWQSYNEIEPLAPHRYDALQALVSSLIANIFTSSNKKFSPSDFMPNFTPRSESISDKLDELLKVL